jgi:hypothetical protein
MKVAEGSYFLQNKIQLFKSAKVASIMLGAIYHRPALGTYFLGESLNRLGESLQTTSGDDFKPRKRMTLRSEWIVQMNFHIRRVGEVAAHNAIWDTLHAYYKSEGMESQITNRLKKPGAYEKLPEVCEVNFRPSFTGDDEDYTCYEKKAMPSIAVFGAKAEAWWEDLTSIRYARTNPQVVSDFWRAMAVLAGVAVVLYLVYHFSTKKPKP